MTKERGLLSCRDVLWFMVFCGFAINYMLRINMNIAIVAMVIPRSKPVAAVQCQREHNMSDLYNSSSFTTEENSIHTTQLPVDGIGAFNLIIKGNRYAWNEYEQGLALGAYYWLHWLTQLPGGLLARRYGTKKVFGCGNFFTALFGFLIPLATYHSLYGLVFLRALQGLIAGVIWPSMHNMTARWIPPNERSRFVSAYLGSSVGAAITYPLCAAIISAFGWEAAFYVTSMLAVVWCCFWTFLVYDSPREHPRISDEERNNILQNLSDSVHDNKTTVPWKEILTSGPVWVNCVAQWGAIWGFLTLMTQAPSYFNYVHGWNVNTTGILSGLPHVLRMLFAYMFSSLSDWLLRTKKMSRTNVRKLATFMCTGVQGIMTIALGFSGCKPYLAVAFMTAGTAVNGAVSAGILSVFVDLSPNYASVLLGFSGLVIGAAGYVSPFIVGVLTNENQTIEQWRLVFLISALNLFVSCIAFTFCGTAEEQPWNRIGKDQSEKMSELQTLNPKEGIVTNINNIKNNDNEINIKLCTSKTNQNDI